MSISPIIVFIVTAAAVIGYRFISVWNYTKFSVNLDSRPMIVYDSIFFGSIIFFVLYTLYLIPSNYVIFPYVIFPGLFSIEPNNVIVLWFSGVLAQASPPAAFRSAGFRESAAQAAHSGWYWGCGSRFRPALSCCRSRRLRSSRILSRFASSRFSPRRWMLRATTERPTTSLNPSAPRSRTLSSPRCSRLLIVVCR